MSLAMASINGRVRIYPGGHWEPLGKKQWEVSWCTARPKAVERVAAAEARGEYDELDLDRDIEHHYREFRHSAKGPAMAYAKRMARESCFGCANVTEQVVDWFIEEDGLGEWIDGERVEVSG